MNPDILSRFSNVRPAGKGYQARCPAHDDDTASLSIGEGDDGRTLLHCFAGCDTDAILSRANLAIADLFPPKVNGTMARRVVAHYDYRALESGVPLRKLRWAPKSFSWQHYDGTGYVTGLNRHTPGLYRLGDVTSDLVWIVEGEKDCDRLQEIGIAAVTNGGGAGKWPAALTAQLVTRGITEAVVIPDHDSPGRAHAELVAGFLTNAGIVVRVVPLPDVPDHGDVSDYLTTHTKTDLLALVKTAPIWTPTTAMPPAPPALTTRSGTPATPPTVLDPADPLPSAKAFLTTLHTVAGCVALQHQAGVFYAYNPTANAYYSHDEATVRADLYKMLEPCLKLSDPKPGQPPVLGPFKPNKAKVEHILDALRAVCNLPSSIAAPCWLQDDPGLDPADVVACRNGLLHIPTRTLRPPTPAFFTLQGLDFAYDPDAPPPAHWLRFLTDLWPDDADSQAALQEAFGYNLTPRTHLQKVWMFVGPKRSGKGTIARVMRRLLGERNCCGPTLSGLAEQFGLATLIDKSLAVISDARIGGRTDTSILTERLLSISGEDALSIPRKFLPDWTGKLPTRFWLLTNELPKIEDASGAMASRFLVLRLTRSFYGCEDHGLLDKLLPELPGILNWALAGYDRLYARGRFVQPASANDLIQEFEDLGSPIGAFLRERCEVGKGFEVSKDRLFTLWKQWCQETGRERPGTIQTFGRNLRSAVPWLGESRPHVLGVRVRYFEGVRPRDEAE